MRLGLIALFTDQMVEPALRDMLPSETAFYVRRVAMGSETTTDNLMSLEGGLEAAANLMPNDQLDVMAFACTSGTIAIGPKAVAGKISVGRPDVQTTDPLSAALAGFRRLSISSVALLTPYIDHVNEQIVSYIRQQGITVPKAGTFNVVAEKDIPYISPRSIVEAASQVDTPSADAVFISCTELRSHVVIDEIERAIGKPIVASNQALAWRALDLAAYGRPVIGYGRLMAMLGT
jgi:maleate isomerase